MKRSLLICLLTLGGLTTGAVEPAMAQGGGNCPKNAPAFSVNITSATTTLIVAGQPGKKVYVWQFFLENNHASTDVTVTWKDGSTALNGAGNLLKAGGGSWVHMCSGTVAFSTSNGGDLNLTTSAAGTISGQIQYTVE